MANLQNDIIMYTALAVAIGIPVLVARRKRRIMAGFDDMVRAKGFRPRATSPIAAFADKNPPDGMHFASAFEGTISGDVPATLILFRRTEAVPVNGVMVQNQTLYFGLHLAPTARVDAARLFAVWQEKLERKKDRVAHVSRPEEGGILVIWNGPPSRANVESSFSALQASLK